MASRAPEAGLLNLAVISHKPCWASSASASGYATDGGFPMQMRALSELFDATTVLVPRRSAVDHAGEIPLAGRGLAVSTLTPPMGRGLWRKLLFPLWVARNAWVLVRETRRADVVHAPIPGDVGTMGIFLALILGKRLFVRHCGNWFAPRTAMERFWKRLLERIASAHRVVLATGGDIRPPSDRNRTISWIFSTSLSQEELRATGRLRENLPGACPRLIIACRQEKAKGTALLIESLSLIRRDFPGATLEIVGDGSGLDEFRRLAMELGVDRHVLFSGRLDHDAVLGRLRQADLFCYPTSSEGFPKAVLEALACGLPVLTTRVSVLPSLIETGSGVLLDRISPEAIGAGVRFCLSSEKAYRDMSARAIETAKAYSLEEWSDSIRQRLTRAWGPLQSSG